MTMHRKTGVFFLATIAVLIALSGLAVATTATFTVNAGEEVTRTIKLAVDDRVLIRFNVAGQESDILKFSLTFPNGTVVDFGEIGVLSHSFISNAEGDYTLKFTNNDLTESKLVTLDYEIEHYLFGMPQMLLLALVIAVICVVMIAVYILMGKSF
jgi:hypothetical protein